MTTVPNYLLPPQPSSVFYGRLVYVDRMYMIVDAPPAVLECAKRVLPGCAVNRQERNLRFAANRRVVGELSWLMTRYPLVVDEPDRFDAFRESAIAHARRRVTNAGELPLATLPATFNGSLYDFQAAGVTFLRQNERALLADDMGLGKTVTALAAIATANAFPALLVVPPNVRRQWHRAAEKFIGVSPEMLMGRSSAAPRPAQIYITSYNLLQDWQQIIEGLDLACLVFDEVQELRHGKTFKYSSASVIAQQPRYVWGLSGTPIYNHGVEIWSVLNILEYHCLGDREAFTREWCAGYGSERVTHPDALRDHLLREGLLLRRRKSEVMKELPPKHRVVHPIEHDESVYGRLISRAVETAKRFQDIRGWHQRGEAALQIDQETRMATGIAKARPVAAFVDSLLRAGERPLLYAWHHQVHDILAEELQAGGWKIGRITGKETQASKDRTVEAFGAGKLDGVLLSLRATAGLDGLQQRASTVVFAELDWSPAIHSQCEDRVHRVGVAGLDRLMCYYLVSRTGFDGVVMDALGLKIGQFVGIMGDAAESEDDRAIANQAAEKHLQQVIDRLIQDAA